MNDDIKKAIVKIAYSDKKVQETGVIVSLWINWLRLKVFIGSLIYHERLAFLFFANFAYSTTYY